MDFDAYHRWYYDSKVWTTTTWLGVPALKSVQDLWLYQEIVYDLKPDLIVELGVRFGGSALYFASILDQMGTGQVLGIDITLGDTDERVGDHPRVTLLEASSVSAEAVAAIKTKANGGRVFAVADSDHRADHVLAELRMLGTTLKRGDYVIVEDSNINGHPVLPDWGPGPMEAMDQFFDEQPNVFRRDTAREEKFGWTFAPNGFLIHN